MNDETEAGENLPQPANSNSDAPMVAESLDRKGAIALARRLEKYWHSKGYTAVRFWTEPIGERFEKVGTYELYRVVCNLVNGLPPRYRE